MTLPYWLTRHIVTSATHVHNTQLHNNFTIILVHIQEMTPRIHMPAKVAFEGWCWGPKGVRTATVGGGFS